MFWLSAWLQAAPLQTSALLVSSRNSPLISVDVPGSEKRYIICLHDIFSTNSPFFFKSPNIRADSQQPPPSLSPATGDVGQIPNDFVWAFGLGATRECEGRPTVWETCQVREEATQSLRLQFVSSAASY